MEAQEADEDKVKEATKLLNSVRGQYIVSQALCIAIKEIEGRPPQDVERSNVNDMKLLLNLFPVYAAIQDAMIQLKANPEAMKSLKKRLTTQIEAHCPTCDHVTK